MFIDWLIHIGIELFIICLSLKCFCLIYNVYVYFLRQHVIYVYCFYFNRKLYISTGNIRDFEEYIYVFKKARTDPLSFKFNRFKPSATSLRNRNLTASVSANCFYKPLLSLHCSSSCYMEFILFALLAFHASWLHQLHFNDKQIGDVNFFELGTGFSIE